MGRWVTSKGRRIYIPDEGEENPYAKKDSKKEFEFDEDDDVVELEEHSDPEYWNVTKGIKTEKQLEREKKLRHQTNEVEREKRENKLRDRINKDFDTKEKQIAANKAQTQAGAEMESKISDYQNKFLTKRSDKELDDLENNLKKSTSLVGTTEGDQVAFAAIERERKRRKK